MTNRRCVSQFCTEASIVLLMVGTLIGGIAQVGEVRSFAAAAPSEGTGVCKAAAWSPAG